MSEQVAIGKAVETTAASGVLIKLIIFSLALGIAPISSYFASQKYLWNGNSTYAAITAVFSANLVLFAYIIASLWEDTQHPSKKISPETKKKQ